MRAGTQSGACRRYGGHPAGPGAAQQSRPGVWPVSTGSHRLWPVCNDRARRHAVEVLSATRPPRQRLPEGRPDMLMTTQVPEHADPVTHAYALHEAPWPITLRARPICATTLAPQHRHGGLRCRPAGGACRAGCAALSQRPGHIASSVCGLGASLCTCSWATASHTT